MPYVQALTEPDITEGRNLWQSLRGNQVFPVLGAFWLFDLKSGVWHLLIATPRVDAVGPRNAYAELAAYAQDFLPKIELISPKHPLYQALRSVFGNTASVEGVRLANTQIGGFYLDDAYLYEIR